MLYMLTDQYVDSDGTDFEWCFHDEIESACQRPHLRELGQARQDARLAEREATEALKTAVILAADNMAETLIAAEAQVDRMTVRDWLGK